MAAIEFNLNEVKGNKTYEDVENELYDILMPYHLQNNTDIDTYVIGGSYNLGTFYIEGLSVADGSFYAVTNWITKHLK